MSTTVGGSRGIGFIELVEFVEFIGLMKRKRVEGPMPKAFSNRINPENAMNKSNYVCRVQGFSGSEGG
jgi:hypothetical protein